MGLEFVTIDSVSFQIGDWIRDKNNLITKDPSVIVNVFDDMVEKYIVVRSPSLRYEIIELSEFMERVKLGRYELVIRPRYQLGQVFKNKFTEETIEIKDVPHQENEEGGVYMYYVYTYTPTFGYNYECKSESELLDFYNTEGVTLR